MRPLVVDNFDSFTWNLVQLLGSLGAAPEVVRNDEATLAELIARRPSHVVLSPGPGTPDEPRRVGVSMELLRASARGELRVPVLGVCLGHQALAVAFGGRVVTSSAPRHGKTSLVEHASRGIFAGLPSPFPAMRYHSLIVDRASIPACLEVTAWCKDGTVMGVSHRELPLHGVQFHPESIGTPLGVEIVRAFLRAPAPSEVSR